MNNFHFSSHGAAQILFDVTNSLMPVLNSLYSYHSATVSFEALDEPVCAFDLFFGKKFPLYYIVEHNTLSNSYILDSGCLLTLYGSYNPSDNSKLMQKQSCVISKFCSF